MYRRSEGLPFIVFHYPPLYHLVARAALTLQPSFLAAGRLVSVSATVATAPLVAALVLIATQRTDAPITGWRISCAATAGMLVLCLHAFHVWGMLMRVDMLAVMLSALGLYVGAWADSRFWGTTAALLLCVAACFTKQTQLAAGISVFLIALIRNPRAAVGAASIAGGVGLAALGSMQWLTAGGFLHNIVADNLNRLVLLQAYSVFRPEWTSLAFMLLMLAAAGTILNGLIRRRQISGLRQADRPTAARAMLLLYFAFASLMLVTVFKSGSNFNYLLEWLFIGCVLIGVLISDIGGKNAGAPVVTGLLILAFLPLPTRLTFDQVPPQELALQAALVQRIRAAQKPVASENMTLLMMAGKEVTFEPAIVTELATLKTWDEKPLLDMIGSHGFAFMITTDDIVGGGLHRTAGLDAAMRVAYPIVERVGYGLWLHLPRGPASAR